MFAPSTCYDRQLQWYCQGFDVDETTQGAVRRNFQNVLWSHAQPVVFVVLSSKHAKVVVRTWIGEGSPAFHPRDFTWGLEGRCLDQQGVVLPQVRTDTCVDSKLCTLIFLFLFYLWSVAASVRLSRVQWKGVLGSLPNWRMSSESKNDTYVSSRSTSLCISWVFGFLWLALVTGSGDSNNSFFGWLHHRLDSAQVDRSSRSWLRL